MTHETSSSPLQSMIDRASSLSAAQVDALGTLWESDEELMMLKPDFFAELEGEVNPPFATNQALIQAWERALDAAGTAGRVDEIEAARAAGRAVHRDDRHLADSPSSKNGAEEATRSAVLAVGVKDLISDADYQILVGPWQHVLGPI